MLTVLIRYKSDGREVLIEAKNVEYLRAGDGAGLCINLQDDSGTHFGLSDSEADQREVFVMNSNGKTIARYDL